MTFKNLPYFVIGVLLIIILLQNQCSRPQPLKEIRDSVIVYEHIRDTIPGKPLPPKIVKDTVWLKDSTNTPDTTYNGLLKQYITQGNRLFEKKTYSTPFDLGKYGSITVNSTVKENSLIGSTIVTDLKIPTTTIEVKKEAPAKTRLYYGISVTGTKSLPINGIYGDLLLKTKKEKIYNFGVGWNGEVTYKGGIYWPLTFKKTR